MQGKLQLDWRNRIIFILMIIMMAALFFSRAILSASIVVFAAVSFIHPKQQIKKFFSSPLLWGMSLLFFVPLLSGLWSEDQKEWRLMMLIKLPLLLLPLAFAGAINFSRKEWEWLAFIFIALVTGASIWSMFHYITDIRAVNEGYLRAKTLITPLDNDHVRFSWLISVAILFSGYLCITKNKDRGIWFWILAIITAWLAIFLHILAARTGLISFYIMLTGLVVWIITAKTKQGIILLILLAALPFLAYKTLPTFQNKIKYFLYDLEYSKKNDLPARCQ